MFHSHISLLSVLFYAKLVHIQIITHREIIPGMTSKQRRLPTYVRKFNDLQIQPVPAEQSAMEVDSTEQQKSASLDTASEAVLLAPPPEAPQLEEESLQAGGSTTESVENQVTVEQLQQYVIKLEQQLAEKTKLEEQRKEEERIQQRLSIARKTPHRLSLLTEEVNGFGISGYEYDRLREEHRNSNIRCVGCGDTTHGLRECFVFATATEREAMLRDCNWCNNCCTHSVEHNNVCKSARKLCGICIRAEKEDIEHNVILCKHFFTPARAYCEKMIVMNYFGVTRTNFRGGNTGPAEKKKREYE